jgi:PAS domain S-box-containing protein
MTPADKNTVHYYLTLALGVIPLLLSLAVLTGWYIENETLVQVHPSFVPMQFNTALGFFLAAAGFIAALTVRKQLANWCAGSTIAIGVLTLFQYLTGVDLGIDQLLMTHYITVETSHPGRMAPNTALCFSLSGIAVLLMNRIRVNWILVSSFGSLIIGLGIVAFTGYMIGLESAYGWASLTKMAVHTAGGFIFLGFGVLAYCGLGSSRDNINWTSWSPIPISILVLTITACLSQALQATNAFDIAQNMMLIFGVVLAVALGVSVHLAQKARLKAKLFLTKVEERTLELTEQKQRLDFALQAGKLGTWDMNLETGINTVDDNYARMLDYDPGEFPNTPETWEKNVHPDDVEVVKNSFNDYINELTSDYIVQYRAFSKHGATVWVEARGAIVERDTNGKAKRIAGTQVDITEQKEIASIMESSEKRFQQAMEVANVGVWDIDIQTREATFNDQFFRMLGHEREDFKGKEHTWAEMIHPDDAAGLKKAADKIAKGDTDNYQYKFRMINKSGDIKNIVTIGRVVEWTEDDKPARALGIHADITEQTSAYEEVERQKTISELTMENMDQGIVMYDKELNMLAYNYRYTEVTGIPREFVEQAKNYEELIEYTSEHLVQDNSRTAQAVKNAHRNDHYIYEIPLPSGKTIQVTHCPMEDGGAVRMFSDITERKQKESLIKLRLETERIVRSIPGRLTLESDEDAGIDMSLRELGRLTQSDRATYWQCNDDGSFWSIRGEWCADGVESQKEQFQNMPSSHLETLASWRLLENGKPTYIKDIYDLPPEQSEIREFFECMGIKSIARFPILEDGNIVAFLNLNEPDQLNSVELSDLNLLNVFGETLYGSLQRRHSEERLAENKQLLESIIENCGAVVYIKDFDGRLILVNRELEEFTGKNRSELVGKLNHELYPEEIADEMRANDMEAINAGRLTRFEESPDGGKSFYLSLKFPLYDIDENITGVCNISTEITEQKILQKDLELAKTEAEAGAEAKSNFLAAMSHEIRTPMNGVIGMVDLLRQTELDKEQSQMLQTISDSGQSLLTIINDILDFSKIEAGKLDIESIPMSLTEVVEGSAQTIATNAERKGVRLVTYIDPSLPQFISGDPVRIRQILINLGGNAVKFTEEGTVVIRVEKVEGNKSKKALLRFSVIDNGIGISELAQEKLFEAFSQAETSTTRKYGGTGLGLSICQRLTEMMGGEVAVKSTLGEGSEFSVTIPFEGSDKVLEHSNVSDLKGLRVLIVVDDDTEQTIIQSYLEYWHAETVPINDIDICLDTCRAAADANNPFDIVVLGPQWPREIQFPLRDKAAKDKTTKHSRFVSLLTGKRRMARLDSPESVCIDVNPLRRAAFLSAVAIAAGRASPEVHYEEEIEDLKAAGKAPTVDVAKQLGTLILVAEDNPTNRDVVGRQLNLLGYAFEMADDGKLALEAWRNGEYAILLTDCHMPNMDGFELTDAIRKDEESSDKRVPIVAITANALQGEAERCLAAGMDDYMSKPIDMKELREKLRRWMPLPTQDIDPITGEILLNTAAIGEDDDSPIDESALKSMFGDDPETFKEILVEFISPSRDIIKEIKDGWESRSAEAVQQAAHKLKSSARSIGANGLADLCQALETAGKKTEWETIDSETPKIDSLMNEVAEYINAL